MIFLDNINCINFPGGELHITGNNFPIGNKIIGADTNLFACIRCPQDILKLLLFTDAYKRYYGHTPNLYMPYIPYARQDRVANEGESLSIKVFCDIINLQGYKKVYVFDPHSDVCMALLDNVEVITHIDDKFLCDNIPNYYDKIVVAPDAGSYKKLCKVIPSDRLVYATKQRDTKTGKLSHMEIHSQFDLNGKDLLVVDDICDGGGTFILLSQAIKDNYTPNSMQLYVSHGIFSKGLSALNVGYDKVYTTNSFFIHDEYQNIHKDYLTVIDLIPYCELPQNSLQDEYYVRHAV